MFIVTIIVVCTILIIHNIIPWYGTITIAIIIAFVTTTVELYTPNGLDTITCPISSLLVMLPLIALFGGI